MARDYEYLKLYKKLILELHFLETLKICMVVRFPVQNSHDIPIFDFKKQLWQFLIPFTVFYIYNSCHGRTAQTCNFMSIHTRNTCIIGFNYVAEHE